MQDIEKEFVHLVRLSLEGKNQDVQAFAKKVMRKFLTHRPDLQALADEALSRASSPTRGNVLPPLPVDLDTRAELLRREFPVELTTEPIWSEAFTREINNLYLERKSAEELTQAGLFPTRTVLFVGPPGVGKTLGCRWLARNIGWPLLILDLASVMSSFLGRTGNNIRAVLEYARKERCILLLDEFDAIAKRRDDSGEVGELKRLVTVILQAVDEWPEGGLLIAATNHPELLDPAMWRRFERVFNFTLPGAAEVRKTLTLAVPELDTEFLAHLSIALNGRSHSEIHRLIRNARRDAVICSTDLKKALLLNLNEHFKEMSKKERYKIAQLLTQEGLSQRMVSELTGMSRDTIRKYDAEIKTTKELESNG